MLLQLLQLAVTVCLPRLCTMHCVCLPCIAAVCINPSHHIWVRINVTVISKFLLPTAHYSLHTAITHMISVLKLGELSRVPWPSEIACMHVLANTVIVQLSEFFHLAVTMSSKSPPYLSQRFSLPSSHYNTRSASSFQLNLPPKRSSFGQKSFSFMGVALWWSLSQNIRDTRDFARFYSLCQWHFYQWYLTFIACMCMIFTDLFLIILYYSLIIEPLHDLIYQLDFDF